VFLAHLAEKRPFVRQHHRHASLAVSDK
jgi:hypothetical protein